MTLTLDGATGGWMSTKASQMWNTLRVNSPSPGLAVGLSEMPDELAPDPFVSVKLLIDAEGAPLLCEPEDAANETWSGVACDQAIASKFEQRQSKNDETVPYIRTLVVEFEVSGG